MASSWISYASPEFRFLRVTTVTKSVHKIKRVMTDIFLDPATDRKDTHSNSIYEDLGSSIHVWRPTSSIKSTT
jgi:hypothetical protein